MQLSFEAVPLHGYEMLWKSRKLMLVVGDQGLQLHRVLLRAGGHLDCLIWCGECVRVAVRYVSV
jgi:hypothetical protein